jgi:hypothetical protein
MVKNGLTLLLIIEKDERDYSVKTRESVHGKSLGKERTSLP